MNDMRKLMEAIGQINEVSDFDGPVDKLIAQFEETCAELGITDNVVKQRELTQVVLARAFANSLRESDIQYPDYAQETLEEMLRDMQQLEEDTLRVYQEAASEESKARPDYTEMLLNELRETLKQITEIVEKYD